jgi:hypothetical protein
MANPEHLEILRQGVEAWNQWRRDHVEIWPDLSGENFSDASLGGANFMNTNLMGSNLSKMSLWGVNFTKANLQRADISNTSLRGAVFIGADLNGANLSNSNLWDVNFGVNSQVGMANLTNVNFSGADLSGAYLSGVNLQNANFSGAILGGVNLDRANLTNVDLTNAKMIGTSLGDVDLSMVKGLDTVDHLGPSTIGIDTILKSQGKIPEAFFRNAGIPVPIIEAILSLKSRDYYSCFISYSSKNEDFARQLHDDLVARGVRCWFAPKDMKIGDRIRPRIDESIRIYDKLLLVLSEHSVSSKWVEFEVEAAMDKEQEGKPPVLFPVRLDNTVMESTTAWAAHIKRTRHIGDFTDWKNHDSYQTAFTRLLRDLKPESQK